MVLISTNVVVSGSLIVVSFNVVVSGLSVVVVVLFCGAGLALAIFTLRLGFLVVVTSLKDLKGSNEFVLWPEDFEKADV